MSQESLDDLSEIMMSEKTELTADLSKLAPGSKSTGSLKNSSESDVKPIGSTGPFAGTARTTAVDTGGIRGMSNGQSSVSSLWSDMAAVQLGGNDMMPYHGQHMSLYAPLMVSYVSL